MMRVANALLGTSALEMRRDGVTQGAHKCAV